MLKRIYVRLLLWALGPAIKKMVIDAKQVKHGLPLSLHHVSEADLDRMTEHSFISSAVIRRAS